MKRSNFIAGFVSGALIFGAIGAVAAQITASPNPFPIKLNGENVNIEGYNISGSTYFKLRDISEAVGGFDVDFKDKTIILSTKTETEEQMTSLLYQGHGSFRLTTDEGKVIYIDPYAGEGYDAVADAVLITHEHPDHNRTELITQMTEDCVVFRSEDAIGEDGYIEADIAGVHVEPVQAYNQNHDVTKCVGYLVTVGDTLLYFAGDTSKTDQMAELADKNIDYAFLPTDGHFNMDMPEAIECAELIQAKHTVPVHMSPGSLFDPERAALFDTPSALIVAAGEVIKF